MKRDGEIVPDFSFVSETTSFHPGGKTMKEKSARAPPPPALPFWQVLGVILKSLLADNNEKQVWVNCKTGKTRKVIILRQGCIL